MRGMNGWSLDFYYADKHVFHEQQLQAFGSGGYDDYFAGYHVEVYVTDGRK